MAKQKAPAQKTAQEKVKMVSNGARIMDAVLAVVFLGLALKTGWWLWWASSALCVVTAVLGPLDHLYRWLRERFLQVKQGQ